MDVEKLKEAIRLAESAGDTATAEQLRKQLQRMSVNS